MTIHGQLLVTGVGVLLLCLPAFSQLNSGSIAGGITDQSGAAIVGAKVTITDVERGVSRPLVTDTAGQYTAPSLTPGQYTVRAENTGFTTVERTTITLGVGPPVRLDLPLQPAAPSPPVTPPPPTTLLPTTTTLT